MSEEIVQEEEVVEEDVEETEPETEDVEEDEYSKLSHEEAIERLKKADRAIINNKRAPKEQPKSTPKETVNNPDSERLDRMELRQEGYSPEVIDEIMKLGGVKALSNPLIKSAATEMQAKHTAEQAADITDGPQSQTRTKYSAEDLKNMSAEEMEKVLPHAE